MCSDTIMKVLYMGYTRPGNENFDFRKALYSSVKNFEKNIQ